MERYFLQGDHHAVLRTFDFGDEHTFAVIHQPRLRRGGDAADIKLLPIRHVEGEVSACESGKGKTKEHDEGRAEGMLFADESRETACRRAHASRCQQADAGQAGSAASAQGGLSAQKSLCAGVGGKLGLLSQLARRWRRSVLGIRFLLKWLCAECFSVAAACAILLQGSIACFRSIHIRRRGRLLSGLGHILGRKIALFLFPGHPIPSKPTRLHGASKCPVQAIQAYYALFTGRKTMVMALISTIYNMYSCLYTDIANRLGG